MRRDWQHEPAVLIPLHHLAGAPPAARSFSKAKAIYRRARRVHPRTVVRWADGGKLTRSKINARLVLFDEKEVETLLNEARIELPRYDPSLEDPRSCYSGSARHRTAASG